MCEGGAPGRYLYLNQVFIWLLWQTAHPIGILLADASQYFGWVRVSDVRYRGSVGNSYKIRSFV